jgi:transposase
MCLNLQDLVKLIESRKSKIEYLPQYSPDFSPIGFTFTDIKTIVKKPMRAHDDVKKWAKMVINDATALEPTLIANAFGNCSYRNHFD